MAKPRLTRLRENQCRAAAREVLENFHACSPKDINVETIAWLHKRLRVRVGGLTGSEGRLVANKHGGIIRVASKHNFGRFRFTVGHELGHYLLHPRDVVHKEVSKADLTVWNNATEEAEANVFAAEFLMPESLLGPHCRGVPSIAKLDKMADLFQTSLTATAFQYYEHTAEPVAIVLSHDWQMKSFRPFRDSNHPKIRFGTLSPDSAAGERLSQKSADAGQMVRSPAYAWLEGFEDRRNADIWEDSRYLEYYETTLTILWIDEDLGDTDSD